MSTSESSLFPIHARSLTVFVLILLALWGSPGRLRAIVFEYDSGYTATHVLEGQPSTGTQWTRQDHTGNTNAAIKVSSGTGVDRQQAITTQPTDGSVAYANYNFAPSSTDLGGTFSASSIIDYSFSMRLESNPNSYTNDVLRVQIGHPLAADIRLSGNGLVRAYSGSSEITLKTSAGGSTNFVALGGVYFTVSGQVNYGTGTFTVFINGVAQKIGGTTSTNNFTFEAASTSPELTVINSNPGTTGWQSSSLSHFRVELDPTWSGPVTITSGGTYTGNWASTDASTPAVTVATSSPVTIQNSRVKGPYNLIATSVGGTQLTVTQCKAYGQNPNVSAQVMPRFIYAYNVQSLVVTNNYMESTAGIVATGNNRQNQTIKVSNNYAFNIDGRLSDGAGGYSGTPSLTQLMQFCQFNSLLNMATGLVSWNKIVNIPNESRVEDTISVFRSGGNSSQPIQIYDNYVQGGYPVPATGGTSYTGTGIDCGDGGGGDTYSSCSQYVSAYSNVVVNYYSVGMAIFDGHDISCTNNQVYSCALIGSGNSIDYANAVGVVRWDLYGTGTGVFTNNTMTGNQVGWANSSYSVPYAGEYDYYFAPAYPAGVTGNTWYSSPITPSTENGAVSSWYSAVSTGGINIGTNW